MKEEIQTFSNFNYEKINNFIFLYYLFKKNRFEFLWGLGIGDWGLGIGGWGFGPNTQTPTPQNPNPKPQHPQK